MGGVCNDIRRQSPDHFPARSIHLRQKLQNAWQPPEFADLLKV
jgi:hypothetical protein